MHKLYNYNIEKKKIVIYIKFFSISLKIIKSLKICILFLVQFVFILSYRFVVFVIKLRCFDWIYV